MQQASVLRYTAGKNFNPLIIVHRSQSYKEVEPLDSIFIRADRKYVKLLLTDIIYIEALRNYIRVVTHKQKHLVLMKIGSIESLLPVDRFRRIHRSYIISLQHVENFDSESVYVNGKELPVGKSYRKVLKQNFYIASG